MRSVYKSSDQVTLIPQADVEAAEVIARTFSTHHIAEAEASAYESAFRRSWLLVVALSLTAGVVTAAALVFTSNSLYARRASDAPVRPDRAIKMSGRFVLHRYDNFDRYMSSLGIPEYMFGLIKNASEVVEIREPEPADLKDAGDIEKKWSISIKSDFGEHKYSFRLGQAFTVLYSGDTSEVGHLCDRPEADTLVCSTVDIYRGWNIYSEMVFNDGGYTQTSTNVDKSVSGVKTYLRVRDGDPPPATPTAKPPFNVSDSLWEAWE